MVGDRVQGVGWLLLGWLIALLTLFLVLGLLSGCAVKPLSPQNDRFSEGYALGYQQAINEIPITSDLILYKDKEAVQELMDCTACERCVSAVPDEAGDPNASCMDRANCLLSVARGKGYLGYVVVMNFTSDYSHAIVMFPTKDDGNVFVEPWFDEIVPTPVAGEEYLDSNNIIEKIAY